jgi:hypothetical protein
LWSFSYRYLLLPYDKGYKQPYPKKTELPGVTHNYIEVSPELLFERELPNQKGWRAMYYGRF